MPTSPHSHGENPNTYFIEDRFSKEELNRLVAQEQVVTANMGGVLAEQANPGALQRVLDVACGPGGWLRGVAQEYSAIPQLIGVDISPRMIEYAQKQTVSEQLSQRVEFHVMDVQQALEFPDGYFDLVNQRLATSFLRTWDWPKLLGEFMRVTRPGGIIRLTESGASPEANSPAMMRSLDLLVEAFYQSGHLFSQERMSVPDELPKLLNRYGLQNVQTREYIVKFPTSTPEGRVAAETANRSMVPFVLKWAHIPDDYDEMSRQAACETQQPDFVMSWRFRTIWGIVPMPVSLPGSGQ